jgi:CheY-like chemotaxis protein
MPDRPAQVEHRCADGAAVAKILLVDDDHLVLRAVSQLLASKGHQVHQHDSGFGVVENLRRLCPDLLLLDVSMPGLDAKALLPIIDSFRSRGLRDVVVALFSGMDDSYLSSLARRHNASVISKRMSSRALLDCIDALVPRPRSGDKADDARGVA